MPVGWIGGRWEKDDLCVETTKKNMSKKVKFGTDKGGYVNSMRHIKGRLRQKKVFKNDMFGTDI